MLDVHSFYSRYVTSFEIRIFATGQESGQIQEILDSEEGELMQCEAAKFFGIFDTLTLPFDS